MRLLVATGIFPPQIGGPAQYAKEITKEFVKQGHTVQVVTYTLEKKLPLFFRHIFFFLKVIFKLKNVDAIVALDTFSVGMPAVFAAKLFRKKILIRTGGDFLWESYVERTGDMVLFRNFYDTSRLKWNQKEKIIFFLTRLTLHNVSALIFSTQWQKDIFTQAYKLDPHKNFLVENFYGPKIVSSPPIKKIFIAGTRPLKWKNTKRLNQAFALAQSCNPVLELDLEIGCYEKFLEKINQCYAVILVSLGDISPNMILDAIRCNKPFILSRETGLKDRLQDIAIWVDPENIFDIKEKILWLANPDNYAQQCKKISAFTFSHSWTQIYQEFLGVMLSIK